MHYMTSFLLMSAHTYMNTTYSFDALNNSVETATGELHPVHPNILGIDPAYEIINYNSGAAHIQGESSTITLHPNKELLWPTETSYNPMTTNTSTTRQVLSKRDKIMKHRKSDKFFRGFKMNAKNVFGAWKNKIGNKKLLHKGMFEKSDKPEDLNWGEHLATKEANLTEDVDPEVEWTEETDDLEEDFDYSTDEREPLNLTGPIVLPLVKASTSSTAAPVVITKLLTITQLVTLSNKNAMSLTVPNSNAVTTSIIASPSFSSEPDSILNDPVASLSVLLDDLDFQSSDVIEVDTEYDEVFSISVPHRKLTTNSPTEVATKTDELYNSGAIVQSEEETTLITSQEPLTTTIATSEGHTATGSSTLRTHHEINPMELIEYEDGHFVLGRKQPKSRSTDVIATATPRAPTPTGIFSILPIKGTTMILHPTSFANFQSQQRSSEAMNNKTTPDALINQTSHFNKSQTSKPPKSHHPLNFGNLDTNASITALASEVDSPVFPRRAYSFTGVIPPKKQFVLNSLSSVTKLTMYSPFCIILLLIVVLCL